MRQPPAANQEPAPHPPEDLPEPEPEPDVDEASKESFPASDPPAWTPAHVA